MAEYCGVARKDVIHKNSLGNQGFFVVINGRAGGIRTHDPLPPRQVRYQAALQPAVVCVLLCD